MVEYLKTLTLHKEPFPLPHKPYEPSSHVTPSYEWMFLENMCQRHVSGSGFFMSGKVKKKGESKRGLAPLALAVRLQYLLVLMLA
jgi:hypothetical protein